MKHLNQFFLPLICIALMTVFSGCKDNTSKLSLDQIKIVQGADQTALPGAEFSLPLRLELLSSVQPGLLGGAGSRKILSNREVFAVPVDGSQLEVTPGHATTDISGVVRFQVKAKNKVGDQYLKIFTTGDDARSITVRFVVGIKITGMNQEGSVGNMLEEPITVTVVNQEGLPLPHVPVYFNFTSTPEGYATKAKVSRTIDFTNENGEASTQVKLGEKTGEYMVGVEVAAPESGVFIRNKNIRVLGIHLWGVVIAVLGGLAIFVLGMKLMSDGLQKVAGENMKKLLQFFAGNAWIAAFAGTVVTAVIQSSSATTVMVIGFINAGLLNLTQSIGIIFGANVGTTVTAQIISFNLSSMALPAIIIGFLITISKNRVVNGWGEGILGFGLLFYGMMMMSNELKVLGSFPSFINFFQTFNCAPLSNGQFMPIGAVLGAIGIGTLMTVLIQSSSAAMGIVLALSAGGLIDFYTAIPLLLGTNIGTTITAFLASLAANRVAKQAALAHTMFNVFGTVVMIIFFYVPFGEDRIPVFLYFINAITPGNVFAAIPQNIERHIAMAHTFFNVTVVLILLPFINVFTKVCTWILPVKDEESVQTQMLEPHLLNTPSVALEQAVAALRAMVRGAWDMVDRATNEHFLKLNNDEKSFDDLAEKEQGIDAMQVAITDYLVKITRHELSEPQSEIVPLLMHCTNDAERIADHTENILQLTERLIRSSKKLSDDAGVELKRLSDLVAYQADCVIKALNGSDLVNVENAMRAEQKINKMAASLEDNHVERLRNGECNMEVGVIFIEMVGELEKIADHLTNIAERTPEIQKHYIKI